MKMKLYHFTQKCNVEQIQRAGIRPGFYPHQLPGSPELVSLTNKLNSDGHGLIRGEVIHEKESSFEFWLGKCPDRVIGVSPNRKIKLYDMAEVAIEIEVDTCDPNLWNFQKFANNAVKWIWNELNREVTPDLVMAAALASADFPLNNGTNTELDRRTISYLSQKSMFLQAINDRDWYFYNGVVVPEKIKYIRVRQSNSTNTIQNYV